MLLRNVMLMQHPHDLANLLERAELQLFFLQTKLITHNKLGDEGWDKG